MKTLSGLFCAAALLLVDGGEAKATPVSLCDGIAGNLVSNCGFETGDFTSWAVSGNDTPGEYGNLYGVEMGADPDGTEPNSGSYQAYFGDLVANETTLSETISTTPGMYTVSLYLAQDTTPGTGQPPNSNALAVTFDGISVESLTDVPVEGYTHYSGVVAVTDSSSVLSITLGNDLGFFQLDDVSVVGAATPEPSSWTAGLLGCLSIGACLGFRKRRTRAGA
jgi:hypothetical protein